MGNQLLGRWGNEVLEKIRAAARAFVLGPGVVEPFEAAFGHPTDTFSPEEYGNYIATSNAVYSCATLRAGMLCTLPWKAYRLTGEEREARTSGRLYELLRKVNPYWTMRRLTEMSELSLCLWGKNFWFLERGESGREVPREIWWGRPDRVRVVTDEVNYISKFLYYPEHMAMPLVFEPSEVVWFRYANPLDEFEGLSPMAAARLAADLRSSAMLSNKKLFDQGMQLGGAVFPKQGATLEKDQAAEIENAIAKRYQGVDKAHRWAVFRYEFEMKSLEGITSRDAEFLGTLNMTLDDIARAYKIPLDFLGGQRTYENVEAAERAIWNRCLKPEAMFLADEVTEQLLPMFPGEADVVELDLSEVEALHEAETQEWERAAGQIESGAITINEWRKEKGKDAVEWGDAPPWERKEPDPAAHSAEAPFPVQEGGEEKNPMAATEAAEDLTPQPPSLNGKGEEEKPRMVGGQVRAVVYGSEEHRRIWQRFVTRADKEEERFAKFVSELLRRQRDSVLAKMGKERNLTPGPFPEREGEQRGVGEPFSRNGNGGKRGTEAPFDKAEWIKRFRQEARPVIREMVKDAGEEAAQDLEDELLAKGMKASIVFKVTNPAVKRFIERRAQRFAEEVNNTTWELLRTSLGEGIEQGESLLALMERVKEIMVERIRSSAETIARTEVLGALNGGKLEAWRQSEVVKQSEWVAALDNRTRESHTEAHGQVVDIGADFVVGNGRGPAPGQIGLPEEDINCRCTNAPVIQEI